MFIHIYTYFTHNWCTEPARKPAPRVLAQARLHEHGCTGTGTCDEHINTIPYNIFSTMLFKISCLLKIMHLPMIRQRNDDKKTTAM